MHRFLGLTLLLLEMFGGRRPCIYTFLALARILGRNFSKLYRCTKKMLLTECLVGVICIHKLVMHQCLALSVIPGIFGKDLAYIRSWPLPEFLA